MEAYRLSALRADRWPNNFMVYMDFSLRIFELWWIFGLELAAQIRDFSAALKFPDTLIICEFTQDRSGELDPWSL
jgi:hypothetical protein